MLDLTGLKLRTHQVTLEVVAAGHGFHLCLSAFLKKNPPEVLWGLFCCWIFVLCVCVCVWYQWIFFPEGGGGGGRKCVCVRVHVCLSARAFVYSSCCFLSFVGQGYNLFIQTVKS